MPSGQSITPTNTPSEILQAEIRTLKLEKSQGLKDDIRNCLGKFTENP
ncbi:hypothetical protein Vi05172_g9430 [Venturia inaequalis]|nr:hypothetical protein Vi05172_g9430 [Venturia inaequalis]